MGLDDQRYYETLYGFYTYDWSVNHGVFSDCHYLLEREYIDAGCATMDCSAASITHYFIFPHYTKKIYWIEGVIVGQITLMASGATSTVTAYRATLCKAGSDNSDEEIISTGWQTINVILPFDAGTGIGTDIVLPFWIDCWEEKEMHDEERIYFKVEVNCDDNCMLYFANGGSTVDLKLEIPIRG